MARLVDDLLDMSRITRGKIELRKERVELAPIVDQAVEAVRSLYRNMNHELTVTLADAADASGRRSGAPGAGGGESVEQRQQIHRQGRSRLADGRAGRRAGCHPGARTTASASPPNNLPRIFEMFAQVDTSLERSRDGLGIGLTLVKTLVEMHGGTVDVHSDGLGRGSEFVVRLPILSDTSEPALTAGRQRSRRRSWAVAS